jgi:2-polyprenyl-6-methoxyphenol hydroxylase-like FAD-dependent oxidoreductase
VAQVAAFAGTPLDISDFPTRHPYGLGLWQNHIERILADWVGELPVTIYREREVTASRRSSRASTSSWPTAGRYGPNISSGATEDAVWSGRQPASSSPVGMRPRAP